MSSTKIAMQDAYYVFSKNYIKSIWIHIKCPQFRKYKFLIKLRGQNESETLSKCTILIMRTNKKKKKKTKSHVNNIDCAVNMCYGLNVYGVVVYVFIVTERNSLTNNRQRDQTFDLCLIVTHLHTTIKLWS